MKNVEVVNSFDPNEKIGPAGYSDDTYASTVVPGDTAPYSIYFENDPAHASAAAQEVVITDQLSSLLDWSTLEIADIAWGDHEVNIPEGSAGFGIFQEVVDDWRPEVAKKWWVDVETAVSAGGVMTCRFRTLDPDTGEAPEDPFAGFLPVNDGTGRGEGHISFTARVKNNVTVPQELSNQASIVFDGSTPIVTNKTVNTVDNINRPPDVMNPGDQESVAGDWVTLKIVADDPDGRPVAYQATGLPEGIALNPDTGVMAGRADASAVGSNNVTVIVTDGVRESSSAFNWTVKQGTVQVPNLSGATLEEAAITLQTSGLALGTVVQQASATVPKGQVISQDPAAGESVVSGTTIDLVVSSGPAQITVSDINNDGDINAADVQLVINAVLGRNIGNLNADVNRDSKLNATDVQMVINAVLGRG